MGRFAGDGEAGHESKNRQGFEGKDRLHHGRFARHRQGFRAGLSRGRFQRRHGPRRRGPLAEAAAGLKRTLIIPADAADLEAMKAALEKAVSYFGGLDGLVNNAGAHFRGSFESPTPEGDRGHGGRESPLPPDPRPPGPSLSPAARGLHRQRRQLGRNGASDGMVTYLATSSACASSPWPWPKSCAAAGSRSAPSAPGPSIRVSSWTISTPSTTSSSPKRCVRPRTSPRWSWPAPATAGSSGPSLAERSSWRLSAI